MGRIRAQLPQLDGHVLTGTCQQITTPAEDHRIHSALWPVSGEPRGAGNVPPETFHKAMVPSRIPAVRRRPSDVKASE